MSDTEWFDEEGDWLEEDELDESLFDACERLNLDSDAWKIALFTSEPAPEV